jgi:hypothetical protein
MANSVTTDLARGIFAKAHGEGLPVPQITTVAWGTGGVDASGNVLVPSGTLTAVPGEVIQKPIESYSYPIPTTARFTVKLSTTEANGNEISSCGLYDSAGNLIAVKNFSRKAKDSETELVVTWDEEF